MTRPAALMEPCSNVQQAAAWSDAGWRSLTGGGCHWLHSHSAVGAGPNSFVAFSGGRTYVLSLQSVPQPPCQSCVAPPPPVQGWLQPCACASCRDCVELQLGLSLQVAGGSRRCRPPHGPSCGWWEARTAQRLLGLGLQAAQLGGRLDLHPRLQLLWRAQLLSLHPACPASSCSSWAWGWLRQGRAGAGLSLGLCSREPAQGVAWAALGGSAAVHAQMALHGLAC